MRQLVEICDVLLLMIKIEKKKEANSHILRII